MMLMMGNQSYVIPVALKVTNRQTVTKRKVDGVVFGRIKFTTPISVERKRIVQIDLPRKVMTIVSRLNRMIKPRTDNGFSVALTLCEANPNVYDTDGSDRYDINLYRQMVGSLVYAMVCIDGNRPDLSYVVTKLLQKLLCSTTADAKMLKHVFRYLKGTCDYRYSTQNQTTDCS